MKPLIKNRNNWFLVSVVVQNELVGTDKSNKRRRCPTWINTYLINASSISTAYDRALVLEREGKHRYPTSSKKTAYWKVVGVCDLIPIYDDIQDGIEISWYDQGNISVAKAERAVVTKTTIKKHFKKWIDSTKKKSLKKRT